MKLRFVFFLMLAVAQLPAQAPERIRDINTHGWYSYSGDHPVKGRWGVHFDAQWRRANWITDWQQYQLRPGVNFKWTDSVFLTLGYAFTRNYPYGDFPADAASSEHRIYQQVQVSDRVGRVDLSHRYRLEQRYFAEMNTSGAEPEVSGWRYQNRFRYQVKAAIPLFARTIEESQWYLPVSEEIFVNFGPNHGASTFDQNRVFAGVGYDLGEAGRLEAGYMNQLLAQRNGRILEYNHTVVVSFLSDFSLGGE